MEAVNVGSQIQEIGEVVRTAVAPVFLLSGVGVTLTLLTNRLARVVDRARALEEKESNTHENDMHALGGALSTLERRARLLGRAISMCTILRAAGIDGGGDTFYRRVCKI